MNKPLAVIFSGAGLSADSGIPTFRDSNGLWEQHKIEDVATHEAWFKNKPLVLEFYKKRLETYQACKPHEGHFALAKLEEKFEVVHITQNIDDLLEQAGCTSVIHYHGKLTSKKCEWHKNITTLDGDRRFVCDYKAALEKPIEIGEICPKCGGQLRPDVVWFNEAVDVCYARLSSLKWHARNGGGLFLCVGTSGQVYPASDLLNHFSKVERKYIINTKPVLIPHYELLIGSAKEQLPIWVERMLASDV